MTFFKCVFFFLQNLFHPLYISLQFFELLGRFLNKSFIDLLQFLPKYVDLYTFLLFYFSYLNLERVTSSLGVVTLGLTAEETNVLFWEVLVRVVPTL